MKIAVPPTAPVPERKPELPAPSGTGRDDGFKATLATVQPPGRKPEPPVALASGQTMPPPPAQKPEPPVALASGQSMPPLPAQKPEPPVTLASGQSVPPLPTQKPAVPPTPTSALASADTDAGRIALASQQVAGISGHSFVAILAQATQESGLDPTVKSRTSSAAGAFQFLERTWLDLFGRHGAAYGLGDLARQVEFRDGKASVRDPATRARILELRHDVDLAAGMAARYLAEGREGLSARLKRPVTEVESRIAYVMGVGGAAKLIRAAESNGDTPAADLLPGAAKANGPLFYESGSGRPLTARETVARLSRRMESDQRGLFAAIDRAALTPTRLDGRPSGLNPFQTADVPTEPGDAAGATG